MHILRPRRTLLLTRLSMGLARFALPMLVLVACSATARPPARGGPGGASDEAHAAAIDDGGPADPDGEGPSEGAADASDPGEGGADDVSPRCPEGMALVAGRVCVDRYEASLVEVLPDGSERPYAHYLPVDGHEVRAVSAPGVFPQGYVSELQAEDACIASGKRLCTHDEWKAACMGPSRTSFPYGDARRPGVCHDAGKSAVAAVFGAAAMAASSAQAAPGATGKAAPRTGKHAHASKGRGPETVKKRSRPTGKASMKTAAKAPAIKPTRTSRPARTSARPASVEPSVWTRLNDPRLGQVEGALARTGDHGECVNGWGVYDMVGNLHEWVATDPAASRGTFAGGYYLDTARNGDGCQYRTVAHAREYHDYSTGFRCCADPSATAQEP